MDKRFVARGVAALSTAAGLLLGGFVGTVPAAHAAVTGATVTPFGDAPDLGGLSGMTLAKPVVAAVETPTHQGYWLVSTDGGVYSFGDAKFFGSTGGTRLNEPIVGVAATPTGLGYWLVARDGGIFAFGDATFFGSTGAMRLNQPIVGMAATPTGRGYWLVARDGGIFAFGDATFFGSTGAMTLNQPIVGMAATPSGKGYWLVASDGGIFAYGDAQFFGSTGAIKLNQPITAMTATASGKGYWLVARDGGVFAYGDAGFFGKVTIIAPDWAVFALLPTSTGQGYWQVAGPDPQLPTLRRGDTGPAVAELQQQLQQLGYWLSDPAGVFGDTTVQAMYAFQGVESLPRTGAFDGLSRLRLKTAVRPASRSTSGDLVEVDKTHQVLLVVRGGRTSQVIHTSTGTERNYTYQGQTYLAHTWEGTFRVWSQVNGVQNGRLGTLIRPKYFTTDGEAVHGEPASQVPNYPASHGCVRISEQAINWIWDNSIMPMGSTVVVY
ncbi:MAG: L,D-transpeptidase [Acidimicrobiia bacterium]